MRCGKVHNRRNDATNETRSEVMARTEPYAARDYALHVVQGRESPMKAIVYREYGSADVLKLEEVLKPAPGDNEVLIKVHAAAVNPL